MRHVFLYCGDIKNYPEYLPRMDFWLKSKIVIESSLIPKIKKIIGDVSSPERESLQEYLVRYSFGKQEFIHILDSDWWDAIR